MYKLWTPEDQRLPESLMEDIMTKTTSSILDLPQMFVSKNTVNTLIGKVMVFIIFLYSIDVVKWVKKSDQIHLRFMSYKGDFDEKLF